MKKALPFVTALVAGACLSVGAQTQTTPSSPNTMDSPQVKRDVMPYADSSFLKDVAQANHTEIEAAKLAQTKATSSDIKSFAKQMADDHMKAQEELQKLADTKGVKLPDGPSLMQKARLKLLESGDAAKFDQRYAENFGVKAHDDTVKMFEKEAAQAKDSDVKAFAEKMLPTLKHHQSMASTLEASVNPSAAGKKPESTTTAPPSDQPGQKSDSTKKTY
jgi:putative membrane protein